MLHFDFFPKKKIFFSAVYHLVWFISPAGQIMLTSLHININSKSSLNFRSPTYTYIEFSLLFSNALFVCLFICSLTCDMHSLRDNTSNLCSSLRPRVKKIPQLNCHSEFFGMFYSWCNIRWALQMFILT